MARHSSSPKVAPWLRVAAVRRFVNVYGWRAYALPVLAMVTGLSVVQPAAGPSPPRLDQAVASSPAPGARSTVTIARAPASRSAPPMRADLASRADRRNGCAGTRPAQLVVVSINRQRAWLCAAGRLVRSTAVTSGTPGPDTATPTGTWRVYAKETDRFLTGPGYREFVHYWVPFHGDFGFHDAAWQTMPFGSPQYKDHGSHGCLHLPDAAMSWLYRWIRIGATVAITP